MASAKIQAWALDTFKNNPKVIIEMLLGTMREREIVFQLAEWAGIEFNMLDFADILKMSPSFVEAMKQNYFDNWELFDCWGRFEEDHKGQWARLTKMLAFGMTREEIEADSKRRDSWTPLKEKRKGRW